MQKKYRKTNTNIIVGKIENHEQLKEASHDFNQIDSDNRKVLIIHTGGTIGMFKDENGKFEPKKDQFKKFLQSYPYFSDESETYFIGCQGFTITPETIYKKKIWYKFEELEKLIDSTNMNIDRINKILEKIQSNYHLYDAFIVLHGTDTMSFVASSLSFMIENLQKTVIFTGSQVPMGQTRNDALNNLLCALTIAGHYHIPEVLVMFDNVLMRGNRTTKTSASSFNSFKSPNYYPIGTLGLKIQIKWELVRMCKIDKPTKFTKVNTHVGLMKLTPFGLPVQQKTKYLVIESYGVGNVPTQGPFYQWLKSNSQKEDKDKILIVNISQVYQSVILNLYATGDMAVKLGLISGSDMTCQAAVSKLSFLASQNLSHDEIKQQMVKNLRGQLTQLEDRQSLKKQQYVSSCTTMLEKNFINQSQKFKENLLYNVLPKLVSEKSGQKGVNRLIQNGLLTTKTIAGNGTLLHQYFRDKENHTQNSSYLSFLLSSQIDLNSKDDTDSTALFYAIENKQLRQAQLLKKKQGKVITSWKRVSRAIRNNESQLLQLMIEFGDEFYYTNSEGRNVFTYSLLVKNRQIFHMFAQNLDWQNDDFYLKTKDIYKKAPHQYIEEAKWNLNSK